MVKILMVVLPGLLLGVHAQGFEFLPFREGHLDLIWRQGRTRALRTRVLGGPAPHATMDPGNAIFADTHFDAEELCVDMRGTFALVPDRSVERVAKAHGPRVGEPWCA